MESRTDIRHRTVLLIGLFFLASGLHVLDRILNVRLTLETVPLHSAWLAFGSTVLFVLNLLLYFFILITWMVSVHRRLLPSAGRNYLLLAALMMLFFLFQRAVKYRLALNGSFLEHVLWYTFYVPLAAMPTLFLLTCLSMGPGGRHITAMKRAAALAFGILILLVLTNDLHHLMFRPVGASVQTGTWETYEEGPLWYVFYGYLLLFLVLGLIRLARIDRRVKTGKQMLPTVLLVLLLLPLMLLTERVLEHFHLPSPWTLPEASVFSMVAVFEICIRSRLIPYNEDYEGIFRSIRLPAMITDRSFEPVYRTASTIQATSDELASSLNAPLELSGNARLYGRSIASGSVFWQSDESAIRRLNEEIADVVGTLETENDLIRYENEQKEERARVDARNRVYSGAAAAVYGTEKKIKAILDETVPGTPEFSSNMAKLLVLNAYVKRRSNFFLASSERDTVTAEELYLAFEESARFLTLAGIRTGVEKCTEAPVPNAEAAALYDTFEQVAEALPEDTKALMITITEGSVRLMADCERIPDLKETPAAIRTYTEDGQFYLVLTPGKGGAS